MRQFKGDTNPIFNLGHTKNGIQRFGKKTFTRAIFARQYS
jgi:hypothetical protein